MSRTAGGRPGRQAPRRRRSPRFGAHMSVAGGVHRAVERAVAAGCDSLQIFTSSPRQWSVRPLGDDEVAAFRKTRRRHGLDPAVAHASYLINLASGDGQQWRRSWRACADELRRCGALGLDGLVLHPGAHGGDGVDAGLDRVARGLDRALEAAGDGVRVLVEGTAGQGTALGADPAHLAWLLERFGRRQMGLCLDTCHLHAAGLALNGPRACARTLDRLEAEVGFDRLHVLHCNDSEGAAGSRLDRHAHPGRGTIGTRGFRALLTDGRLAGVAAILETPKDDDGRWDRTNLARLRAMWRGDRRLPPPPPRRPSGPSGEGR